MKTVYIIFIGLLTHFNLMSQSTILSSANKAIGTTGTITYSVGQLMYTTTTSSNGSTFNGVQQPFEITNILNVDQTETDTKITVYPNPSINFLTLKINGKLTKLNYDLHDVTGRLLTKKKITKNKTLINTKNLLSGSYLLKIKSKNQIIKIIKIIKK